MKRWRHYVALILCMLTLLSLRTDATTSRALPAYGADISNITVSGLSSGAYMAGQFAVAYSSLVAGVAIIAGGPYYCAGHPGRAPFIPYLTNALSVCMNPQEAGTDPPDPVFLWNRTLDFARAGLIDDPGNLRHQAVYLYSGHSDHTVTTAVVDRAQNYYQFAGVARLHYRDDLDSGHGMITDSNADNACTVTAPPYFNNCGVPLAQEIMTFFYAGTRAPASQLSGHIVRFDQRPFTVGRSSMDDDGYAYVPAACTHQSCRVHVAFHGCRQGAQLIGDHFYARAGYNAVADSNNIIVLYPQVEPSSFYPYNPRGCWDFWGYSSLDPLLPDFYTRDGVQMRAVRAMLERLAAPRGSR